MATSMLGCLSKLSELTVPIWEESANADLEELLHAAWRQAVCCISTCSAFLDYEILQAAHVHLTLGNALHIR